MSRIQLNDSLYDVMYKMAEGNPGAITVLLQLIKKSESIDPDNLMGGIGPILFLDTNEIYGPDIWILYKDVCGESIVNTIAVIRGIQLGIVSALVIKGRMCRNTFFESGPMEFDDLIEKIRVHVPNFNKAGVQ